MSELDEALEKTLAVYAAIDDPDVGMAEARIRDAARRFSDLDSETNAAVLQVFYEREFPCRCTPEYADRGLVAPDCEHHYAEDFARAALQAIKEAK